MLDELADRNCAYDRRVGSQSRSEPQKARVIASTDASPKPRAVVVELHDTVVAHIAMRGTDRPEDQTGLAKFELADSLLAVAWLTGPVHEVIDSLRL